MNKKFTDFLVSLGMNVNGNKAYGTVKGYETNVAVDNLDNASPFRMHISFYATDEQKNKMAAAFAGGGPKKFFRCQFTPYGVFIGLNEWTLNALLKKLPQMFDLFYGIIADNGGLTGEYCPVCGKLLDEGIQAKKCNVDGYTINLDTDCVAKINEIIDADNKQFQEAPNNYLKGFFGALLGGLAGAAVAVILNLIGFVSAISAVVAVVLGAFLYQKFHGKPNKMMIVIVSLTSLVCMAITVPAIYIAVAGTAAAQAGVSMGAMEAFVTCMEDAEFSRLFYTDLVLILVFSAIGIGIEIFALSRQIRRKQGIG